MQARSRSTVDPGTVDAGEVARFDALAADWWAPDGPMKPLHALNPLRIGYIRDRAKAHFGRAAAMAPLEGLTLLDVGCGGGILCEPMARLGAGVTGIDPAERNIGVARAHAASAGLAIDYRAETVEAVAASGARFDIVLAMEVVEHVADGPAFVAGCAAAQQPGGLLVMSTLNRTLRAFAAAIIGAEYLLRWLPRGTHDWQKFVTPAELRGELEAAGLEMLDTAGIVPDPLRAGWRLSRDTAVNYMVAAGKPGA